MLALDATQTALVAAADKAVKWVFTITDKNGLMYQFVSEPMGSVVWATGISWDSGITWDSGTNLSSIVITDFNGIELRRNSSESGIIAPSEVSFNISNVGNVLTPSDFKGGKVRIELYLSNSTYGERKIAGWLFRIKSSPGVYQEILITAEDFLQYYIKGDYPNTRYPADIFPSNRTYNDEICVPIPFGTAYIPLRDIVLDAAITKTAITIAAFASASGSSRCKITDSGDGLAIFDQGWPITISGFTETENAGSFTSLSVAAGTIEFDTDDGLVDEIAGDTVTLTQQAAYFILGDPAYTYTITKVRAPRDYSTDEFSSASYTFTQSTITASDATTWRGFRAKLFDLDKDGTADSWGEWGLTNGGPIFDPVVQFTRSDTASLTSPEEVLNFVLLDMGVPTANIGSTALFTANSTFSTWGLTFNGGYYYKQDRETVIASILNQCHSCIDVGETIDIRVLSKTSRATITSADILRTVDQGEGTFKFTELVNDDYTDSVYVAWQESGKAQDQFLKVLVPIDAVANVIPDEVLECNFVQDSQDVQRIGRLYGQRKYGKEGTTSWTNKGTRLYLQPDDVITIDGDNYNGSTPYDVLIDSMKINSDASIDFECTKFANAFEDWEDYNPAALVIPTDTTPYTWQPTISGPQTDQNIGKSAFDTWGKEYLTVGPVANQGKFTDMQKALNAVKQAGGGAIYILNGDYQAPGPLYVPDVNLEIVGQSQGGVTLKNHAGDDLFVLHNLTKTFNFHQFSIASQNVAAFSKMFNIYGDTAADNTGNFDINNVTITLVDDGNFYVSGADNGDTGIIVSLCSIGNYKIGGNTIKNGFSGLVLMGGGSDLASVRAQRNIISSSKNNGIKSDFLDAYIRDNQIIDAAVNGIISAVWGRHSGGC